MGTTLAGIEREARQRGITRLCHFTPSRNLLHIASGKSGILATKYLRADERAVFNPTDLQRLDGHEGHICCSIEYPNTWYLDKVRRRDTLFPDWVVLLIDPKHLWQAGTRFCSRNAAAAFGKLVADGEDAFHGLFAPTIPGAGGRNFTRLPTHLPCSPTDDQAEVLIPDRLPMEDILAIAVASETQAKREIARFQAVGMAPDTFTFVIAPAFFDKHQLRRMIRAGQRPPERIWTPGETSHDD